MSRGKALAISLLVGIPLASLTGFVSMILGGAGHGWIAPFLVSIGGIVAFPVAVYFSLTAPDGVPRLLAAMLSLGVLSDLTVVFVTSHEGFDHFTATFPYNLVWIALWASWQVALLFVMTRSDRVSSP